MILVDTSIWVGHLRAGNPTLVTLLERGAVLSHPWVIGELALGRISARAEILGLLAALPPATVATAGEVLTMIERHELLSCGFGYVGAQLLASTLLTADGELWTEDHRLHAAAERLGCSARIA